MKNKTAVFTVLITGILLIAAAYVSALPAFALSKDALYYEFDGITAVYADGNGYCVSDDNGLTCFDAQNNRITVIKDLSGADSLCGGAGTIALKGGKVYTYSAETGVVTSLINDDSVYIEHIAVAEDGIYCAYGDKIARYSLEGTKDAGFTLDCAGAVAGMTAFQGKIYYSVLNGARCDIYEAGKNEAVYQSLSSFGKLAATSNNLFTVDKSGNLAIADDDGLTPVTEARYIVALFGYGENLYFATDLGEIFLTDSSGNEKLIAASESAEDGFYSHPRYAAARMGNMYVCDYLNDRIVVTDSEGVTSYFAIKRPVWVCVNNGGNVIVAHGGKKITVFASGDFDSVIAEYSLKQNVDAVFTDNTDTLYALAGNTLYALEGGAFSLKASDVESACFSVGGEEYYYSQGSKVYKKDGTEIFDAADEIISMCTDSAGNFFMAVKRAEGSAVIKRSATGETSEIKSDCGSENIALSISLSSAGDAKYGDLIVTDCGLNTVTVLSSSECGVIVNADIPQVKPYDEQNLIRLIKADCHVYSSLTESETVYSLDVGDAIMTAKYDLAENANFSYVCVEDVITKKLVCGFVFKSCIGDAAEYIAPPASKGTVYSEGKNLYALPSLNAEKTRENLPKDTMVSLLNFADYVSAGTRWYFAQLEDGTRGYIPASAVSVRNFIPDGIRPQYNAVIKSYNGSVGAKVYALTDGNYEEIENSFLLTGTKIEVVGAFDTSEKYTEIKYFDERLGTCTCYVETVYIDYNNISVVQIIAIVLAAVTFILLVILVVRLYMRNRKL